jgi:nickel-dependent lactate racemase
MTAAAEPDALVATMAELAAAAARLGHSVTTLAPPSPPPLDLVAATQAALAAPAGSPPLRELAGGRRDVAIVTSDATRAVPTAGLLDGVMPELEAAGMGPADVTVVIATGAHRPATRVELERLLGPRWARLRVLQHEARAQDLVHLGRTARGTPVAVHPAVAHAGLRIALGVVEPHEFAGFSGGRKAIVPGVAAYETILANHSVEHLRHPLTRPGVLAGNPVHEDMVEAVKLLGPVFIVNVALDERLRPTAVAAGDCHAAHAVLVDEVRRTVTCRVEGRADVVVTGPGAPLDINLYQAVKSLSAVRPLVDRSSRVLLLAACREGTGSPAMLEAFRTAAGPGAVLEALRAQYQVEQNAAVVLAELLLHAGQVHACCPGLDDAVLETFGMRPAGSAAAGLTAALEGLDLGARVLFVPRAQRLLFERSCAGLTPGARGA